MLASYADTFKKSDVLSIQQSIVNHVEYTIARSRYKFDDLEAYQAAAFSLRDRLIESWNDTQQYFKCVLGRPVVSAHLGPVALDDMSHVC